MSLLQPIEAKDRMFIGEDRTLRFYVTVGEPIRCNVTHEAGSTTIGVEPLKEALLNGSVLRFPGNVLVTLNAAGKVGDTQLTVSATTGGVVKGAIGRQVQDVTGWTTEWVLRDWPGAATAHITKSGSVVTAEEGVVDVVLSDQDTINLPEGEYFYTFRRTNDGNEIVLAFGPFVLRQPSTRD